MLKQEYGIDTEREERIVPNKIGIAPKKKTKQNKTGYGYFQDITKLERWHEQSILNYG